MRTGRMMARRGFSLVETIVSVGIVAAMAAVVVPQVVKQFDSSDTTSLQQDMKNLQTAIETFTVNHRGVFPGDLDDLANPLDNTGTIAGNNVDTSLVSGGTIAAYASATLWEGPYVDFSVGTAGTKLSGYGTTIEHNFVCYEATGDNANLTTGIGTAASQACPDIDATDRQFLAIRVTGFSGTSDGRFEAINDLIDGPNEAGNRATLGRVRMVDIGSSVFVMFYLASPLN
jgi:type II secretory pathway pseudopilin PulG